MKNGLKILLISILSFSTLSSAYPSILDHSPSDGTLVQQEDVRATITGNGSADELTAWFYDNGAYAGNRTFEPRGTVGFNIEGIPEGERYEWSVILGNGTENVTGNFSFRTDVGFQDVETGLESDSVVLTDASSRNYFFVVRNDLSEDKQLKTWVSGVDATFSDSGTSTITYTVPAQSTKRLMVLLEPGDTGAKTLTFKTLNRNLKINTTSSTEVQVNPGRSTRGSVPGIGLIHVVFILVVSTVLYSVQP